MLRGERKVRREFRVVWEDLINTMQLHTPEYNPGYFFSFSVTLVALRRSDQGDQLCLAKVA